MTRDIPLPPPRPRRITSRALWQAMVDAGIFHRDDSIRQFVIVARADDSVMLFVEQYGDERMLRIATAISGITIENVPAPPDDLGLIEDERNPDNWRKRPGERKTP